MKYVSLLFLACCLSCTPKSGDALRSQNSTDPNVQNGFYSGPVEDRLAYMLRRQSGVIVSQGNNSYQVRIRGGNNSLIGDSNPLFIIDGISLGNDFNMAAEAIAGNEIRSVRVLKGQEASFYGVRGAGGVVQIKTEKPSLRN